MRIVAHLRALFDPATTRDQVLARARSLGEVESIVGISGSERMHILFLYHRVLAEELNRSTLPARSRYRLLLLLESGLQDDLLADLQGQESALASYARAVTNPLPTRGSHWADVMRDEMAVLGALPGVSFVSLYCPDAEGVFKIEQIAGRMAALASDLLLDPAYRLMLASHGRHGQSLVAETWRRQEIMRAANYQSQPELLPWKAIAEQLDVDSMLGVPIVSADDRPVAVLGLYGIYATQFESSRMQEFALGLHHRWSELWRWRTS